MARTIDLPAARTKSGEHKDIVQHHRSRTKMKEKVIAGRGPKVGSGRNERFIESQHRARNEKSILDADVFP